MALSKNVEIAASSAGIETVIDKVTDTIDIASFGVMSTPALVIDDHVVSTGKVLTVEQIDKHLRAKTC